MTTVTGGTKTVCMQTSERFNEQQYRSNYSILSTLIPTKVFLWNLSLVKVTAGSLSVLLLAVFLRCLHKYIYWMLPMEKKLFQC